MFIAIEFIFQVLAIWAVEFIMLMYSCSVSLDLVSSNEK